MHLEFSAQNKAVIVSDASERFPKRLGTLSPRRAFELAEQLDY